MAGRGFINVEVEEKDTGWEQFQALIAEIRASGGQLKVGVIEGVGTGSQKREGGISNAELAAVHEFGTADGHIPERSFLRSTFALNLAKYMLNLRTLLTRVLEGKMTVDAMFNVMGLKIVSDIKNRITTGDGIPPPNAPSTVARKRAKGAHNGALGATGVIRPLVDTGRLLASITWAYIRGAA
jgi:hypothetical protein